MTLALQGFASLVQGEHARTDFVRLGALESWW
jgi:hypothetical protein